MYVCGDLCICVGVYSMYIDIILSERKPGPRKETNSVKENYEGENLGVRKFECEKTRTAGARTQKREI
jgi:hypothetical protein